MDTKTWDTNIINLFIAFADEAFQRRSWFGIGPEVSSPSEMCNWLDDFELVFWLEMRKEVLNSHLVTYMEDFIRNIDSLPNGQDNAWSEFYSIEWIKLRLKASVIRDMLKQQLPN